MATLLFTSVVAAADEPASAAAPSIFDRENLVAWCIVPFDSKKRGPEERAAMLEQLGIKQLAYDYRAEHVPTFEAEIDALKRHGIRLTAWWFPGTLNDDARHILDVLKQHEIKTQLWVTGGGGPTATEEQRQQRIEAEANRLRPIAEAAAEIGCQVALYNHGKWFGEPENQIAIIKRLNLPNVGIVYNFHHGHGHIDDFADLFGKMLPYLFCLNLNGMADPATVAAGRDKILPIGSGIHEKQMLRIVEASGYNGPIGILDHRMAIDAEQSLRENLAGLEKVVASLNAGPERQQVRPFPENRVRNFYRKQAQRQLDSGQPAQKSLPDFPGLDGGSFGHWGQNPESVNFDYSLNEVEVGSVVAQIAHHFGTSTPKAVAVIIGDDKQHTALFDPSQLTFVDAWQGGVTWGHSRFGLFSGIRPAGKRLVDLSKSKWVVPPDTPTVYLGLYRNAERAVFVYKIGDATVYDHAWLKNGKFTRSLSIKGKLPAGAHLEGPFASPFDNGETKALATAAPARWADRQVTTRGVLGDGDGPYVIDTLTIPYGKQNPFNTPMRIGGVGFLADGRAAVCTLMGDVWLVEGVDDNLDQLRWTRFAAGLNQPLGLVVQDGKILVAGRDQITRLHDLNNDNEADFYECVSNQFETGTGHDFLTNLISDDQDSLYFFSPGTGAAKLPAGSRKVKTLATGLRNSNGMGVSPDGKIVLATSQEGTWTPVTGIFEVHEGSYHGFHGPRKEAGKYGYHLPLCFAPRGVDNSAGALTFTPADDRFGPLANKILGTSFGNCTTYLVLREHFDNHSQGGIVPLPGEFLSGAHRLAFNPRDGQLYVAGTAGWQSYAQQGGSLQRVRYVGGQLSLPTSVESHENGLLVRFNCDLDPQSVDMKNIFCQQWNYLYSKAYGSAEYSVRNPGRRGHDPVPVRSVHRLDDGRSVFVEIPHLHPVMQFHLHMRLKTAEGKSFSPDVYYSLFHLREPFTNFPGYSPIARKKHYPDFPIAEEYPRDPRLVAQETLGKSLGVTALEIAAVPGLRFQPRRLRVPPGKRVSLTIKNTDISMPHNLVLVTPDRLDPIGEGAMLLASDPRAIAKHYVPDDPGVIAFSPILWPKEQYTIYFDSPKEKGVYPFACSFPGHWRVMRGVLYVVDEGETLPEESEPQTPEREFVKEWKIEDLASDAGQLANRSFNRGSEMFHVAGCIKCHKINCVGSAIGPDLTETHKRFQGVKLLEQILTPSSEIHKEYQSYVIITDAGKSLVGLLVKEDDKAYHLLPNPLLPEQITIIPKDEIDEIIPSKLSTMPEGLLMTLTRDEILDLLAFIEASGDPKHKCFQP